MLQVKGSSYTLPDLLGGRALVDAHRDGTYVTLRLTPAMYHRFHAPEACDIHEVLHVPGDAWNVNPATLRRIDRLYCRNERAVVPLRLHDSAEAVTLVPVAAILVASLQFTFLDEALTLRSRGPARIACRATFRRGDELGHFRQGSTIVVLGTRGLRLADGVREGAILRMGEALMEHVHGA
jgi:phosphatidylserine decarboxylase